MTSSDPNLGRVLNGAYRLEEPIGAGGMGAVYRATQITLGRNVAVKLLHPAQASSQDFHARFEREARILTQVTHPNIVVVFDAGRTEDGLSYIVMEHLVGETLKERVLRSGGLPTAPTLSILEQICAGVGAAHAAQLVHRDLKPANVFLAKTSSGREIVKVLDFGIAKACCSEDTQITQEGIAMGTPGYISPEQIESAAGADHRADIYALGAILRFMLTASAPYAGETPAAVLLKQLHEPPAPFDLGARGLPAALGPVIAKALARDRTHRYASAAEFFHAVRDALPRGGAKADLPRARPATRTSRPWRRPAAIVAVVVLLFAIGIAVWNGRRKDPLPAPPAEPRPHVALATVQGVAEHEILLGMSAPFTGPADELGKCMQKGIRAAMAELNDAGGIHGRRLSLVSLDDAYEPERARDNVARLLRVRKVFGILGNVGTPTAELALPVVLEEKALFFGAFTGAELLRTDPPDRHVFHLRAGYDDETAAIVRYLVETMKLPADAIAVLAQDDSFGEDGYLGVQKQVRAAGVFAKPLRAAYSRQTGDVEPAVQSILSARDRVKAVILVATYKPAAAFIRRLKDEKLPCVHACVSFVGSRALANELLGCGPEYADDVLISQVVPHFASDLPAVQAYRAAMRTEFPAEPPGFVSLEGYLATRLLSEGLRRAGRDLDVERLVDELEEMQGLDLGMGAPVSYTPSDHQALHRVWLTRLTEKGEFEEVELPR